MRTRRKVYPSPTPPAVGVRRTKKPRPPPQPPQPGKPQKRKLSTYYFLCIVMCAILNGISIKVYYHMCGFDPFSSWGSMLMQLATTGSPLCNGLSTISSGLAAIYNRMWIHAIGIFLVRAGEKFDGAILNGLA